MAPNSRRQVPKMLNGKEAHPNFLPLPHTLHPLPPPSMTFTHMLKVLTRLHQQRFTPLNLKFTSPKPMITHLHNLRISTTLYLKSTPHPPNIHHLLLKNGSMPPTNTNSNICRRPSWKSGLTLGRTRITTTRSSRALNTLLTLPGLLKRTTRIISSIPRFSPFLSTALVTKLLSSQENPGEAVINFADLETPIEEEPVILSLTISDMCRHI